jgi:DNA (cytosine-5)-methyltransferase 1
LLDLFSGAGGAAAGYSRAGFDVMGVDIAPQPRYPFPFVQGDALRPPFDLRDFDAVHASPPCHAFVQWSGINREKWGGLPRHPDLVSDTRALLDRSGRPWVMENVVGAPLRRPVILCGSMFALGVRRHRLFEASFPLFCPQPCRHTRGEVAVYGKLDGRRVWTRRDGTEARAARTLPQAAAAMGIDWMEWDELTQAVPPAFTYYLGLQLMRVVLARRDSA